MIIDLQKFIAVERPHWAELERLLDKTDNDPAFQMSLDELKRFHYLYERTSSDLGKIVTFSSEPETRRYLESLVARAYGEIHETRDRRHRLSLWNWFFQTLPQTFRRQVRAFWLSAGITMIGVVFGSLAVAFDFGSKAVILPQMFSSHMGDPNE